ncbi:MAG TPA: hypothetical protein VMJ10_21345 [Kofleriaceae bacterium]|nr:hypothetical protein [Kofleriaceae bacterium]
MIAPWQHVRALFASWPGRFICAFLVFQLFLPLTYYCGRRDPHDERFAWRMFSPMRMAHCEPHAKLDGKPFALESEFHEAWIDLAQRGRFVVIEAMAARLCAKHPGSSVSISLDCTYLDRDPETYGGFDLCQAPQL